MNILAEGLALITRKKRYLPKIEWSSNSWTHNIFRFYEMIFWRKVGIRAEMSSGLYFEQGKLKSYQVAHSFEAMCALIETQIRNFKWMPFKIYIPLLQTSSGFKIPTSPYLLAIALDSTGVTATSTGAVANTWTHTCTGSNLVFNICFVCPPDSGAYTGNSCTYNLISCTEIGHTAVDNSTGDWYVSTWYLLNPTTGLNTASFGGSNNLGGCSISYSGVKQSSYPDSSAALNSAGVNVTTKTFTTTVVAANCWLLLGTRLFSAADWTAGSGTLHRVDSNGTPYCAIWDSNGTVGTGSQSLILNGGTTNKIGGVIASFAPVSLTTTHNLTMLGIGV